MPQLVIGTATLKCSFGTATSVFQVTPHQQTKGATQPLATIQDYKPIENIQSFTLCTCLANPQVAAAKVPQPCVPVVSAPWAPGSRGVKVANQAALTSDSKCACTWGGTIEITAPGQQSILAGGGAVQAAASTARARPPGPPAATDPQPRKAAAPSPQTAPPPARAAGPATHCELVALSVTCEHKGRRAEAGQVLGVVPVKTHGSDTIRITCAVKRGHADDPKLALDGAPLSASSFAATGPVTSQLWIPRFEPRVYEISAETCSGSGRSVAVHAYPSNKISLELNPQKQFHVLKEIGERLKEVLHIISDKVEIKVLEGNLSVEAAWKEHTDARAFYAYKIQGAVDLVAAEFTYTIGPSKIANLASKIPGVGKYLQDAIDWLVKAGVVIQVTGKIGLAANYERKSPDQQRYADGKGKGAEGALQVSVGVVAAALSDKLISVKLTAQAGVKATGEFQLGDEGIGAELGATFDGLQGIGQVLFLWGWVQAKESVTFVEPRQLYGPKEVHLWPPSAHHHPGAPEVAEVHG